MPMERATGEVAKHFYDKYGHDQAVAIISARINGDGAKQDTEFWLDVLEVIKTISIQSQSHKDPLAGNKRADSDKSVAPS